MLIAIGLALFTRAPVDGNYFEHILPVMLVLAAGIGVSFPALMTLAMSGATQEDAGLASGLVNTTAQVGGALGLAVLATLSTTRTDNLLAEGESRAQALVDGYHLAFWIGAALVVLAFVIAVTVLKQERPSRGGGRGRGRGDAAGARPKPPPKPPSVFAVAGDRAAGRGQDGHLHGALRRAGRRLRSPMRAATWTSSRGPIPFPDLAGRCEHLRAWCDSHRRAGATLLRRGRGDRVRRRTWRDVLAALGADDHLLVRLEAEPATLRRRIIAREPEGWFGLDHLLNEMEQLHAPMAGARAAFTSCWTPSA